MPRTGSIMESLVILTRPEHRNAALATRLENNGITAACLPALRLQPLATSAQHMVWPDSFDLVVFVSSHAAQSYLDRIHDLRPGMPWPDHVRLATVGHASAQPLYQAGFIPEELIFHPEPGCTGQDSEGLWDVLQAVLPDIRRVLIVRGQAGREWLGGQFEQHGIQVSRLSLYQRIPEEWTTDQARALIDALKTGRPVVFLLTSSESVDAVHVNVQRLELMQQWAQCRFIVIHERISARLQTILQASGLYARHPIMICAPSDDAICRAIHSSVSSPGSL